jgi:hypothetical protein
VGAEVRQQEEVSRLPGSVTCRVWYVGEPKVWILDVDLMGVPREGDDVYLDRDGNRETVRVIGVTWTDLDIADRPAVELTAGPTPD